MFFQKLCANHIDTFVDIRQRRGVRGKLYCYVNSVYLQKKLAELGIRYEYYKELSPTKSIREMQWKADKEKKQTKKYRDILSVNFIEAYNKLVLDAVDLDAIYNKLKENNAKNVVLFCVEAKYTACHRSLLAERFKIKYNVEVEHL